MSQTCPVFGDLPYANLNGLPPLPLCCNPANCYPQCQTPQYTTKTIGKRSICQILPPAPYDESFILVNLPLIASLLITAIPRYFFCLLYDVGLALYNIASDADTFLASLLDLMLAPFVGFAEGASYGGCYVIRDIINFFSGIPNQPPPTNLCPFQYTLNTGVQNTLELIGFAIGSIFGLIDTLIGFLINGIGIALCFLTNLSIKIGICFHAGPFGVNLTGKLTPFFFLNVLNFMNCGCVLGQLGLCPVYNAVIGNCQTEGKGCPVTNTGCPGVSQSSNACLDCQNQCFNTAYEIVNAQQEYCTLCYQACQDSCNGSQDCISECQNLLNQCNNCVNNLSACLYNQCNEIYGQCYANGGQPPSNCNPQQSQCNPVVCCFTETSFFTCPYMNYNCPTGSNNDG